MASFLSLLQHYLTLVFYIYCLLWNCFLAISNHPLVLLVSFDGFRWDYLSRTELPNLRSLIGSGVNAKWIQNAFVTKTFPNHFTIVTGLYEESHGIINNEMYDPVFNETFDLSNKDPKWWSMGAEPIWITNEKFKGGRYSGGMMWPAVDIEINNVRPLHGVSYNQSSPWSDRVDTVIKWFTQTENPINLGLLYFEEPDSEAHRVGPDSPALIPVLKKVDEIVGYLIRKLKSIQLFNKINLIITSDHGMTEIPENQTMNLANFVNTSLFHAFGVTPVLNILPKKKEWEDEIIKQLKQVEHLMVYRKSDIPKAYHYQNNRRILPIMIEPEEGWLFYIDVPYHKKGTHGFNNSLSSMHPFFIAQGPAFKRNLTTEPFDIVDIYPLLCHILDIAPAPNNGSLENVQYLLAHPSIEINIKLIVIAVIIIGSLTVIPVLIILTIRKCRIDDDDICMDVEKPLLLQQDML